MRVRRGLARVGEGRERFPEIARLPADRIALAEAALAVAAEEYPDLDFDHYLEKLDDLALRAAPGVEAAPSLFEQVERLNHFLFVQSGFRGNQERYDDPRNSFLNDVLDRGVGIPITLSLVYVEIGCRLGLPVAGVGFPGHFLVRVEAPEVLVVDPFFGRLLSREECQQRLSRVLGTRVPLLPNVHLRAVTAREALVRLIGNLKHLYVRERDFERALSCCNRILLLAPEIPVELRDRGLVYEQLECFGAARADLERFLELAPNDESADAMRKRLVELEPYSRSLH